MPAIIRVLETAAEPVGGPHAAGTTSQALEAERVRGGLDAGDQLGALLGHPHRRGAARAVAARDRALDR